MFDSAVAERSEEDNELAPFWVYPGDAKIERHVPLLPLSREVSQLAKLKRDVASYRLVFGQPRQDDLLEYLGDVPEDKRAELRIDLSPEKYAERMSTSRSDRAAAVEAWADDVNQEDLKEADTYSLRQIAELGETQANLENDLIDP